MSFLIETTSNAYTVSTTLDIATDFKKALQTGYKTD